MTPALSTADVRCVSSAFSLAALLRIVARTHGVTVDEMRSPTRRHAVAHARWEFFFRAAQGDRSICTIGRFVGQDHSTVRNGIGRYCDAHGLPCPRGADLVEYARRHRERNRRRHREGRQA